jgi:hypothetical protein
MTQESLDAMVAAPQAAVDGLASGMASTLGVDPGSVRVSGTDPDIGAVGSFSFDRRLRRLAESRGLSDVALSVTYEVAVPSDDVSDMQSSLQEAQDDTSALTSSINAELADAVGVTITGATVTSETFTVETAYPTPNPTPATSPTPTMPTPKPTWVPTPAPGGGGGGGAEKKVDMEDVEDEGGGGLGGTILFIVFFFCISVVGAVAKKMGFVNGGGGGDGAEISFEGGEQQ